MYKETEVIVMASNEESDILTMTVMMGGRGDEARATPALGPLSGSRCFERVFGLWWTIGGADSDQ
jgi:hypothetical protein